MKYQVRMDCQYCKGKCQKAGQQRNGTQKLYCKVCKKYQQVSYRKKACKAEVNGLIRALVCESVGIRGISRILNISVTTVISRVRKIGWEIRKPAITESRRSYEVDELWTYIGKKANEIWIAYALDRQTRQVTDFVIGKRTRNTLKELIGRLLSFKPRTIRTDRLTHYQRLIPAHLHHAGAYCINRIERKNLSIRTHLKRLGRRTICFNRDISMLNNCLRIYYWTT